MGEECAKTDHAQMLQELRWIKTTTAGTSDITHALIHALAAIVEALVEEKDGRAS